MSMGTLGIRIRYVAENEDQFKVEALLPVAENETSWQRVGVATEFEYADGQKGWEFESDSGRTNEGKNRRATVGRGMILMGHAMRLGDVLEDIPKEERNRGRRPNAQ